MKGLDSISPMDNITISDTLASLTSANNPELSESLTSQSGLNTVFVALGLHGQDPGYELVTDSFHKLGTCTPLHESLWMIHAKESLDQVFKKINTSMIDRRIGSSSGLLAMDPHTTRTKWYFSKYIATVLDLHWNQRNDYFIAFKLRDPRINFEPLYYDIKALGASTPISRSLWYVNSVYSPREVFQLLIGRMEAGDQLCILDSGGNVATWEDRSGEVTWIPREDSGTRPTMARIQIKSPADLALSKAA